MTIKSMFLRVFLIKNWIIARLSRQISLIVTNDRIIGIESKLLNLIIDDKELGCSSKLIRERFIEL